MSRLTIVALLLLVQSSVPASQVRKLQLDAPAGWGGETIRLPASFARDMKLKGVEHIRFAPGMMNPKSDSFFSYAFAFEVEKSPNLTAATVKSEFLTYYRGLCVAVLNGAEPELDPGKFTLDLEPVKKEKPKSEDGNSLNDKTKSNRLSYTGTLTWVEPFATKKTQTLNLEIQTWKGKERNFVFACVSPTKRDAEIWKHLHKIRDDYVKKQNKVKSE